MSTTTTARATIIRTYDVEGHTLTVERRYHYTAYPRNGNVGNPTVYYKFWPTFDGQKLGWSCPTLREAFEAALLYLRQQAGVGCEDYWSLHAYKRTTWIKGHLTATVTP